MGTKEFGIDHSRLVEYAEQIREAVNAGVEMAVGWAVVTSSAASKAKKVASNAPKDAKGMLATMINSMALQSALEKQELKTRLLSAIEMKQIAEPFIRRRAVRHLKKAVVILVQEPQTIFHHRLCRVTARREINADVILKGTRVDGVYSADPEKDPTAERFDTISFDEVLQRRLKVMDTTAFTQSRKQPADCGLRHEYPRQPDEAVERDNMGTLSTDPGQLKPKKSTQ